MRAKPGFTLVEIIMAVSLLAMIGALFTGALTYTAQSYVAAAESVEMGQKARLALTRIFVELQEMQDVNDTNRGDIDAGEFHYLDVAGEQAVLRRTGSTITLNGDVLLDAVGSGDLLTYRNADGNAWDPSADDVQDLFEVEVRVVMDSDYVGRERTFVTTVNPLFTGAARAPRLE